MRTGAIAAPLNRGGVDGLFGACAAGTAAAASIGLSVGVTVMCATETGGGRGAVAGIAAAALAIAVGTDASAGCPLAAGKARDVGGAPELGGRIEGADGTRTRGAAPDPADGGRVLGGGSGAGADSTADERAVGTAEAIEGDCARADVVATAPAVGAGRPGINGFAEIAIASGFAAPPEPGRSAAGIAGGAKMASDGCGVSGEMMSSIIGKARPRSLHRFAQTRTYGRKKGI